MRADSDHSATAHQTRLATFLKGVLGGFGAQAVNIFTGLVSVPLGLHYFGAARYGVWMLIMTLMVYLGTTQFGIGPATSTLVSQAQSRRQQAQVIRRAFLLLLGIAVLTAQLFWIELWRPSALLALVGSVPPPLAQEATACILISFMAFLLRTPTAVWSSAWVGTEKLHLERFYNLSLPSILNLACVGVTIWLKGNLVTLAWLTGGVQIVIGLLSGLHLWLAWRHLPPLPGRTADVGYRAILVSGWGFFLSGIAGMLIWNTDNLVISHYLGTAHVAAYSVNFRLFSAAISMSVVLVQTALWPMYGTAAGRSDWNWVNRCYRYSTQVSPVMGGLLCLGLVAYTQDVVHLWTGPSGDAGLLTVVALGLYAYFVALNNAHSTVFASLNLIRHSVWSGWLEVAVNLILSILFVQALGVGGVALGSAIATGVTSAWLLPAILRRRTDGQVGMAWKPVLVHAGLVLIPLLALVLAANAWLAPWPARSVKLAVILAYLLLSWRVAPEDGRQQTRELFQKLARRR